MKLYTPDFNSLHNFYSPNNFAVFKNYSLLAVCFPLKKKFVASVGHVSFLQFPARYIFCKILQFPPSRTLPMFTSIFYLLLEFSKTITIYL